MRQITPCICRYVYVIYMYTIHAAKYAEMLQLSFGNIAAACEQHWRFDTTLLYTYAARMMN